VSRATLEKLERARALLGHTVPGGDLAQVLDRVLDLAVAQLEKRRFGATEQPRACRRRSDADPRMIPAAVRRQVWERDRGRCTFVGDGGHVCGARAGLEFDHVVPVARGGASTTSNLRLRCRAHNHHEAERAYGRAFMEHRRQEARRVREAERGARDGDRGQEPASREAQRRGRKAERERERIARESERRALAEACERQREACEAEQREREAARARIEELVPALRNLGLSLVDARLAAARAVDLPPDSTLEQRLRFVLETLMPRGTERVRFATATAAAPSGG
jgi:hypothetical protein